MKIQKPLAGLRIINAVPIIFYKNSIADLQSILHAVRGNSVNFIGKIFQILGVNISKTCKDYIKQNLVIPLKNVNFMKLFFSYTNYNMNDREDNENYIRAKKENGIRSRRKIIRNVIYNYKKEWIEQRE